MSKRCTFACDTDQGILTCELELADQATIADALAAARLKLGAAAVDWDHAATGIYGQLYRRDHVPSEGDRIELYRPLKIDPRARRRAEAASTKSQPKRTAGR
jgi:putative ubiquitin-RnfH superfamily antitoxin RatB of RatAB toxin-antitoxin module